MYRKSCLSGFQTKKDTNDVTMYGFILKCLYGSGSCFNASIVALANCHVSILGLLLRGVVSEELKYALDCCCVDFTLDAW